jgi:hypothetical protein
MLSQVLCPIIPGVGSGYIEGTPNASTLTGHRDRLTRATCDRNHRLARRHL